MAAVGCRRAADRAQILSQHACSETIDARAPHTAGPRLPRGGRAMLASTGDPMPQMKTKPRRRSPKVNRQMTAKENHAFERGREDARIAVLEWNVEFLNKDERHAYVAGVKSMIREYYLDFTRINS